MICSIFLAPKPGSPSNDSGVSRMMSPTSLTMSFDASSRAVSKPSPSMSSALRPAKWKIDHTRCAGQPTWFGQRRST